MRIDVPADSANKFYVGARKVGTTTILVGSPPQAIDQIIRRLNFYEYVRVSFDGTRPTGKTVAGSRCSLKDPWHMFVWIHNHGGTYVERAGKQNEVDFGHGALAPAPTP